MAYTYTKGFLQDEKYDEATIVEFIHKALGDFGYLDYTIEDFTVFTQDGGALINGYFYNIVGSSNFRLPYNATRYIGITYVESNKTIMTTMHRTFPKSKPNFICVPILRLQTNDKGIFDVIKIGHSTSELFEGIEQKIIKEKK